jgi:4-amino-4-deoxy-L-arabinose transferase-like glycosyltransferase
MTLLKTASPLWSLDRHGRKHISLILILAVINCLVFIFVFQYRQPLDADSLEYDRLAWNLTQGHGLVLNTNPYVTKPPAYVIFVAGLYLIFGHSPFAVLLIQSGLYGLTCVLLYLLVRALCMERLAFMSGIMLASYFPLAYYASGVSPELFTVFLTAGGILCIAYYFTANEDKYLVVAGITIGIAILSKPILICFPSVIVLVLILNKVGIKDTLKATAILVVAVGAVLSPWAIRNYLVFNEFIILSKGNVGSVVLRSVLDQDHKYLLGNDVYSWRQTNSDDPRRQLLTDIETRIAMEIKRDATKNKDQLYLRETTKLIWSAPIAYLAGCLVRGVRLWVSYPTRSGTLAKAFVASYDLTLLALAGIGLYYSRNQWRALSICWLSLIYITIFHLAMHVEPRYSAPMRPYLLMFSTIGLGQLILLLKKSPAGRFLRGSRRSVVISSAAE